MSLEECLEYIKGRRKYVEVTPLNMRMRKIILITTTESEQTKTKFESYTYTKREPFYMPTSNGKVLFIYKGLIILPKYTI